MLYYGSKTRGSLDVFWKNLASLPTGEDALILRTIMTNTTVAGSPFTLSSDNFHYVTQQVSDFRERIKNWDGRYSNFVRDVAHQITEKSPAVTQIPIPEDKRDDFVEKVGEFPFKI